MSANRKKLLFIALGSLLASSTAVAVLTFQTDAGRDADAATSGSTPHTLPAQMAENVGVAGHAAETLALFHPASGEPGLYSDALSPPAAGNGARVASDSRVDTPSETYLVPSDAVEATHNAAAPSHSGAGFGTAEMPIFALNQRSFGGGFNVPGLQSPGSSTPEDPLTDVDPLLPPDSNSNRPDPIFGTGPEDGACDVFSGCGSLDDPPGSVPGDDSPNGEPPVATPVPEPGSMGLLAFGVALGAFLGRRRRAGRRGATSDCPRRTTVAEGLR